MDQNNRKTIENMDESISINYFYNKNRHKWTNTPPAPSRTRTTNLIINLPSVVREVQCLKKQFDVYLVTINCK